MNNNTQRLSDPQRFCWEPYPQHVRWTDNDDTPLPPANTPPHTTPQAMYTSLPPEHSTYVPQPFSSFATDRAARSLATLNAELEITRISSTPEMRAKLVALVSQGEEIINSATSHKDSLHPWDRLVLETNAFVFLATAAKLNLIAQNTLVPRYDAVYETAEKGKYPIPSRAIFARISLVESSNEFSTIVDAYLQNIKTYTAKTSYGCIRDLRNLDLAYQQYLRREGLDPQTHAGYAAAKKSIESLITTFTQWLTAPPCPRQPTSSRPPSYCAQPAYPAVAIPLSNEVSAQQIIHDIKQFLAKLLNKQNPPNYPPYQKFEILQSFRRRYDQCANLNDPRLQLNLSAQFLRLYSCLMNYPDHYETILELYNRVVQMAVISRQPIPEIAIRSMFHVCRPEDISFVMLPYKNSLPRVQMSSVITADFCRYLLQYKHTGQPHNIVTKDLANKVTEDLVAYLLENREKFTQEDLRHLSSVLPLRQYLRVCSPLLSLEEFRSLSLTLPDADPLHAVRETCSLEDFQRLASALPPFSNYTQTT